MRYRDGIAFNYPLVAFAGAEGSRGSGAATLEFLRLEPSNFVLTALKQSEDGAGFALRFYEAEGRAMNAKLQFAKPLRQARKTNLIEQEPQPLEVGRDGALEFAVKPWEIVTLVVS
jgi:alpha-mannosidase